MSQFLALYGREASLLLEFQPGKTKLESVEQDSARKQIIDKLQKNLSKGKSIMKNQADKHKS